MTVFQYTAIGADQRVVRGTIGGETPWEARQQLRELGLVVRDVRNAADVLPRHRFLWRPRRYHSVRVTEATRELATLLAVDVPLSEALDTLITQYQGRFQTSLLLVRDRVAAGVPLAAAMREQPHVFDSLSVCMVEVGENAGNLENVLQRLADFKERSLQLKDRVLSALLYPAIVFSVSMGVSLFLMGFVVPMLLENLDDVGRQLPWPTRLLKGLSDILTHYGMWVALAAIVSLAVLTFAIRTQRGCRIWHGCLLRLPLVGPMARKQEISRVVFVIATLMQSGIVFLDALRLASETTRNPLMRDALAACERQVGAGTDIGDSLRQSSFFPALVVHVFSVGQKSGRLEEMLEQLASVYDRQVASSATRLASALEPLLILLLSVFVGFILFATMLPILEAGNAL